MKFGYTIIYVDSVPQVLAFYEQAFGLATRFLHESNEYGELETGETVLAFATHTLGEMNLSGNYLRADAEKLPLGMEVAFIAEDVPAALDRALAAGATALAQPTEKPWGQTVAYVRSIEGTIIALGSPMG